MNNEVKTKNSKGLIVCLIILLILVIGMGVFIFYDNFMNKEKTTKEEIVKESENKKTEDEIFILTQGELDEYLARVPMSLEEGYDKMNDAYSGVTVKIDDLDTETLYGNVYKNTIITDERPNDGEDGYSKQREETINEVIVQQCVKESDFKSNLKKMYNYEKEITEFSYPGGSVHKVGNYYCNVMGAGSSSFEKVSKLENYYKENDLLIIEEKAGFVKLKDDNWEIEELYDNTKEGTLITSNGINQCQGGCYIYNYGDKFHTFKHTFKKDSNNNYYWYSTELK